MNETEIDAAPFDLEPGSTLAQALYEVFAGTSMTIIESPPGAGKTTLAARLAYYLHDQKPELPVTIVTPTNASGQSLIDRIAAEWGPECVAAGSTNIMPELWSGQVIYGSADTGRIAVQTVASASMTMSGTAAGLYIVDEAFQTPFSEVASAIETADQVVCVGDPGQIGPVVTVDTTIFDGFRYPPHTPAPVVFAAVPGAVRLTLDHTYRLGDDTTDIVGHFYDFPFSSKRTMRSLRGHREIETYTLPRYSTPHDPDMLDIICDHAAGLVGNDFKEDLHGHVERRKLRGSDIAIVVAHNSQRAYIDSRMSQLLIEDDYRAVTVGTADSLQGGQWPAVVSLDPLAGVQSVTDHHSSLGRLCVMLSRHQAHLSFFLDSEWKGSVAQADGISAHDRQIHRHVRTQLLEY